MDSLTTVIYKNRSEQMDEFMAIDILANRSENMIPEFFRIKGRNDNEIYIVSIDEELTNSLSQSLKIRGLYGLSRPFFIRVWLYFRGEVISSKDRKILTNAGITDVKDTIQSFAIFIESKRKNLKKSLNTIGKFMKLNLKSYKDGMDIGQFKTDSVVKKFFIQNDVPFTYIFDEIRTSAIFPFVAYIQPNENTLYKVNDDIKELPTFRIVDWIKNLPTDESIVIKMLTRKNIYTDAVIYRDRIELDLGDDKSLEQKFIRLLPESIKIVSESSMITRGTFSILGVTFLGDIFADLIMNNEYFNKISFVGESSPSKECAGKTVTRKHPFRFYFDVNHTYDRSKASRITVSPIIVDARTNGIVVEIARAESRKQVLLFKKIFEQMFALYNSKKDDLIREYIRLGVTKNELFEKVELERKKSKQDEKTTRRFKLLNTAHPDIFTQGTEEYSKFCGPKPYIVTDPKKFKRRYKKDELLLRFPPGDHPDSEWYACYPRDGHGEFKRYEKDKPKYNKDIYPGVKDARGSIKNPKYPYLPCCFKKPQHNNEKVEIMKHYFETGELQRKSTKSTYILGPMKIAGNGRFAVLPSEIQRFVDRFTTKTMTEGGKRYSCYQRLGVLDSPHSAILCMENAINNRSPYGDDEKIALAKKTRKKLARMDFCKGRQELYGFERDAIRDMLRSNEYFDPRFFVSLLEMYYDCKIYMFLVDDDELGGNILLPRHSTAFLEEAYTGKFTVFLIVQNRYLEKYPRCELLVKRKTGALIKKFGGKSKIVEEIRKVHKMSNLIKML